MLIPRDLMLVVFICLKDTTSSTTPPTTSTTQQSPESSSKVILIVIPILVLLGIAGVLIWCFVRTRSEGFNFPSMLTRTRSSKLDTAQDVQQQDVCNPQAAADCSIGQYSSSNASPTYQVNHALYSTQPNYENVMIGPVSQAEEYVMKPGYVSPADHQTCQFSQPMDYDEAIYENNPSMNDSAVYCNYTSQPNNENDDTYIIPSE
ncbi:uncharacterized protein LOC121286340 isoform X2 [Carcharodon carcharias]|nr:uncharacterized protein LOC121286340 isoform X2 [Carcharodon carcharias]XP_041059542.1 uncharacterized protein LOC121286340 isoform X2 [Carcharodon carcharias]XP_041059595.1 uncharacterized protein LOC121286340 isoform X2 [Carcharodon carcharias]